MALRFLESFDIYGESGATGTALSNALAARWTAVSIGTTAKLIDGWSSGLGFDFVDRNRYLRKTFDAQDTWIIGFAFRQATLTSMRVLSLYDGAEGDGTRQVSLLINNGGKLEVCRRTSDTLGVSNKTIKENTWHYIEFKVIIGNSGSYEVRVNGETWFSQSGVDTQYTANAYASRLEFVGTNTVGFFYQLDDIYVADGAAGVNDFQGPTKIEALWPTGDSTPLDWQVASGNHYDKINERPYNTTNYVYETTANDVDLYTYGNLSVIESNIFGVQMSTTAALSAAGSMTLKERWKAATEIDGASHTVDSTTYTTKVGIRETDTDGNSWTDTVVNAGEFGVKVG
jgi:hypothetical protein